MIVCPFCHSEIDDTSKFCDQCGKELMFCPECNVPRAGVDCPRCGEDLIPARVFLASKLSQTVSSPLTTKHNAHKQAYDSSQSSFLKRQQSSHTVAGNLSQGTTIASDGARESTLKLIGHGWNLPLKAGPFGRREGVYPEFSAIAYISGRHGEFRFFDTVWQVQDYGSTNGTFLNGMRLTPGQWYNINKGDVLRISVIDFQIE